LRATDAETPHLKRCVKLAHAIPLLGDQLGIDGPVRAADQRGEWTIVALGINAVDALMPNAANAWTETLAEHGEGGKVKLGVAVGIGVMLFDFELALVVQQAVENEGCVAVGALDWQTIERSVVISDERVELQREIAKARTVGLLEAPGVAARNVARRWQPSGLRPNVKKYQGP
jgi:hypothetical protein